MPSLLKKSETNVYVGPFIPAFHCGLNCSLSNIENTLGSAVNVMVTKNCTCYSTNHVMMTPKHLFTTLTYVSIAFSLPTVTLLSREINAGNDAQLMLDTYGPTGCGGMSNGGMPALWDKNNSSPVAFNAYYIDRDLSPIEQLDFSGPGCAPFISTAPNAQKKGCYPLMTPASCWRIWEHGGP